MPHRRFPLIYFNDHRCRSFAELRSVIVKARGLALHDAEIERAAVGVERWLLAELERERATRAATADDPVRDVLSPSAPERIAA